MMLSTAKLVARLARAFELMALPDDIEFDNLSSFEAGSVIIEGASASTVIDNFISAADWRPAAFEATINQLVALRTPLTLTAASEFIRFSRQSDGSR